jgi:hypothetical protein
LQVVFQSLSKAVLWITSNIGVIADVVSIIGFGLTIYVFLGVKRIRKQFLSRATLPGLLRDLKLRASELNRSLVKFEESGQTILTILARCETIIDNLKGRVPNSNFVNIRTLKKAIRTYRADSNVDNAWDVYNQLQAVIDDLKYFNKDRLWSS